jgi:UPF0271 protein
MSAPPRTVDLNCDLGEIDTPAGHAHDLALLDVISSANIACGGHAGDEHTMARTVGAAKARGVAIGAHPSYPDVPNFGRKPLDIPEQDLEASIAGQIRALQEIAERQGTRLRHAKPHGALYHAAMTRPSIARLIARAAWSIEPALVLVGQWGLPGLEIWRSMSDDAHIAAEAFADRRYEADGTLRSRALEGALISDPEIAGAQALDLVRGCAPFAASRLGPLPRTICVHSDTPNALAVAAAVRRRLEGEGFLVAPL